MPKVALLTIEDPYRRAHGGTLRTRAFVRSLSDWGYETAVMWPEGQPAAVPGAQSPLAARIGRLKRHYIPLPTQLGARNLGLAELVKRSSADWIFTAVLSQAPYQRLTGAHWWLDFMDLWSTFAKVESRQRAGLARYTASAQAAVLRRQEQRAVRAARVISVAGWADHQELGRRGIQSVWLPTPIDDEAFAVTRRTREKLAGFLANFQYWPNKDAYELLVRGWLPELRRRGWRVVIAGHGSQHLMVPQEGGVEILGPVDDLADFYEHVNITLAPIRLGAGIKVKVIESLARGIPVAGTPQAFEGLHPAAVTGVLRVSNLSDLAGIDRLRSSEVDREALQPYRFSTFTRQIGTTLSATS